MSSHRRLITRRTVLHGAGATVAFAATRASGQTSNWPDRSVRIIVPYPAGGSADVMARIYADALKEKFGQAFVTENRPGAGGNIGIDLVAKSQPDGYTVGAATIGHFSINQFLYQRMPFDPERDIIPVSLTYELPNVAVVSSQHVQARTLPEFIAWAKSMPDGVTYGSPGVGTSPHLSAALFVTRTGIKAVHVPFRGAAQTIPAMLAGDITFAIDNLASYLSVIESGHVRPLAVTASERWPRLPNVPTMAEAGLPNFVVTSWAAFVVPRGTPRPVVDKFSAAIKVIASDPAMKARFLTAGAKTLFSTPEEALAHAAKEARNLARGGPHLGREGGIAAATTAATGQTVPPRLPAARRGGSWRRTPTACWRSSSPLSTSTRRTSSEWSTRASSSLSRAVTGADKSGGATKPNHDRPALELGTTSVMIGTSGSFE